MQTLKDMVNAALRQAESGVKVASLREAPIEDRTFQRVDDYLAAELGQIEVAEPEKQASAAVEESAASAGYEDVRFAYKLAQALQHGAHLVEKLALPGGAGEPEIHAQPFANTPVRNPPPQASARAKALANAHHTNGHGDPADDRHAQINEGPVIPDNYPNGRNIANHANSKHASGKAEIARLLRSKIAQHRMLVSLGQIDAANAVLKEAEALQEASGSSLVFRDSLNGTMFPDNEGVRNLTKAQARDANQREAGNYWGEPVKRDNAVAAHTLSTHGLKLSALKLARRGRSQGEEPGFHETMANSNSAIRANAPAQAGIGGVLGAGLGGLIGHDLGGGAGAALGAGIGGAGLGALGYYGAKGEQAMRDRARGKLPAGQDPGFHEAMAQAQSAQLASVPLRTGSGIISGGLLGGMAGHALGGGPGAALGAGVGAAGLGALGYHGAKGEQAMRQRLREKGASAKKGDPASLTAGFGAGASSKLATAVPGTSIVRHTMKVPGVAGVADNIKGLADRATKSDSGFGRVGQLLTGSRQKAMKELGETPHFGAYAAHNPGLRDFADREIKREGNKVLGTRIGTGVGALGAAGGTYALATGGNNQKRAGLGDFAGWAGRGLARGAGKLLGKADEGLGHLRAGSVGPHAQSVFSKGQQGLAGLSEGAHKAIGGTALGVGGLGTAALGYRAMSGGNNR